MTYPAAGPDPEGASDLFAAPPENSTALPDPHEYFSTNADTVNNVVHARGKLDLFSTEYLRIAFDVLASSEAEVIVVDLEELTSIDQAGISLFVDLRDQCDANKVELSIVNARPEILERLQKAGAVA